MGAQVPVAVPGGHVGTLTPLYGFAFTRPSVLS